MNSASPESRPTAPALVISFPESLPVSSRRDEIARALSANQVVIVCGETGSGKTTQLPKIALALGRGKANGGGLIGHTQPRRLAATSVAKRIAEELNTPLGEVVGYKIRFNDKLTPGASVKLMTDGILLAETQTDPLLKRYDTLIIDEAHERSLNIDFLLGYLKTLLPKRPDLKLIVTSATIDADRFAKHFESKEGPAPVIQVSGRLFPVEQRWRPFEEKKDYGAADAVRDAVDELWRSSGPGDCLVFLPGEREIREVAETLRGHHPPGVEVLPLYARLSEAEQNRVFQPHGAPRIVLATNVAETSLTVPGIRYVVDVGTARVKRYSYRNKVEQLQIEPVSQAAANQRAGRCGRVSNGICIRLYDEKDFAERPRFTDPEILRSSLAGVILRMKSLKLGAVEDFPFIEAPPGKAIADGYQLLHELGAVDDDNQLTEIGRALSRLPLDPRVGRMLLAARDGHCLAEMLIIAASLSSQDVRERPPEQQQQADAKHKPFDDERSEFSGLIKLWKWLEGARGGEGEHRLSHRKLEQKLREHFISPRRVREWRDIHHQLHQVVTEQGWKLNGSEPTYEQLHKALMTGLLGNLGCKSETEDHYLGARGIKFWPHPGTHLSKKPSRWIMAEELVETTRLWGRGIASIDVQWVVSLAGHLIKRQLLEPHWEKKAGEVIALERGTLYGLVVYQGRRVNYGRVNLAEAREIFIREALVGGEIESNLPFLAHNAKRIAEVEKLEHKTRRQDVLVDDTLIHAFYDAQIPADICSTAGLERWYREASKANPKLLHFSREELMRHEAAGVTSAAFPKMLRLGGVDCRCDYLHEPGDARDGLTVTLPVFALNQVSEAACEWLVPGLLEAKLTALCKSLAQKPRARLAPLPDFVGDFLAAHEFQQGGLIDSLLAAVKQRTQLPVTRADFKLELVPPHLFMNLRVVDEHGRQLGMGRNLAALKAEFGSLARSSFQALAALKVQQQVAAPKPATQAKGTSTLAPAPAQPAHDAAQGYTAWTFGELPELMEVKKAGQTLIGFPALIDRETQVQIEVFDEPEAAKAAHAKGLARLFALQLKEPLKGLEKNLGGDLQKLAVAYMPLGSLEALRDQVLQLALSRAFLADPWPVDAKSFDARLQQGRPRLVLIAQEVLRQAGVVLTEFQAAQRKLKDARAPKALQEDIQLQLERLVPKRFLLEAGWTQLQHLPRYLKAIQLRLDKWRSDAVRDERLLAELRPLEQRWQRRVAELRGARDPRLDEFRWQLEELRVGLFAQELRTPQPVSVKRLEKLWASLSA